MDRQLRVLVVDDEPVARKVLREELESFHDVSVVGEADNMKYAEDHADIVRRFGRFPHRNALLGRATSAEEQTFLDSGGFSG